MQIDVVLNGERKHLDMRSLKGKEVDKLITKLIDLQSCDDDVRPKLYQEYAELQKQYASQISGLSIEELDELDVEDRNRIYKYMGKKVSDSMGFGMPSSQ